MVNSIKNKQTRPSADRRNYILLWQWNDPLCSASFSRTTPKTDYRLSVFKKKEFVINLRWLPPIPRTNIRQMIDLPCSRKELVMNLRWSTAFSVTISWSTLDRPLCYKCAECLCVAFLKSILCENYWRYGENGVNKTKFN